MAPYALCLIASTLLVAQAARGQCYYEYTALPNPQGWEAHGNAINNLGHVAGQLDNGGFHSRAFVWTPETGTVQLPRPVGVLGAQAYGINDQGHVVGSLYVQGQGTLPFFWDGTAFTIIETVPGVNLAEAKAINNSDQVVGYFNHPTESRRAFLWQNGVFTDLGPLFTVASQAEAINEIGQIAGYATFPGGVNYAFRIDGKALQWLEEPANTVGSQANGMNNNGMIVGSVLPQGAFRIRGIIWAPDGTHVVEPFGASRDVLLSSVNDAGRVAGYLQEAYLGLLAWQDDALTYVNPLIAPPPPSYLTYPQINNSGQIVSWSSAGTALLRPVWTPGDVNGDCSVNLADLLLVLSNFGSSQGTFPRGDVDVDGDVDLADLTTLLSHWGS